MSVPAAAASTGRREQTKANNRAAIMQAARQVFSELGYDAATVRDVIRRTELASGTFYNYFPDKESVLRALMDDSWGEMRARVAEARRRAGAPCAARGGSCRSPPASCGAWTPRSA